MGWLKVEFERLTDALKDENSDVQTVYATPADFETAMKIEALESLVFDAFSKLTPDDFKDLTGMIVEVRVNEMTKDGVRYKDELDRQKIVDIFRGEVASGRHLEKTGFHVLAEVFDDAHFAVLMKTLFGDEEGKKHLPFICNLKDRKGKTVLQTLRDQGIRKRESCVFLYQFKQDSPAEYMLEMVERPTRYNFLSQILAYFTPPSTDYQAYGNPVDLPPQQPPAKKPGMFENVKMPSISRGCFGGPSKSNAEVMKPYFDQIRRNTSLHLGIIPSEHKKLKNTLVKALNQATHQEEIVTALKNYRAGLESGGTPMKSRLELFDKFIGHFEGPHFETVLDSFVGSAWPNMPKAYQKSAEKQGPSMKFGGDEDL